MTFLLLASSAFPAPFTINVNVTGGLTASQQAIFGTAADTWMGLLPEYKPGISIAELIIDASGVSIDGPGGILGSAGPTLGTNQGGYLLATAGVMQFDSADLTNLETSGSLLNVILHEMAHVIGFGTLWTYNGVYSTGTGQYTGPSALAAYRTEFGQPGATFVPVELGGGSGTANGHWNEIDGGVCCTGIASVRGDMTFELMTGWLNSGSYISLTTINSFEDIGYLTNAPEPGTFVLMGAGIIGLVFVRRRGLR
jgi:hypothetical protein